MRKRVFIRGRTKKVLKAFFIRLFSRVCIAHRSACRASAFGQISHCRHRKYRIAPTHLSLSCLLCLSSDADLKKAEETKIGRIIGVQVARERHHDHEQVQRPVRQFGQQMLQRTARHR